MHIKHFTEYKSIKIALKYTKMTKSNKTDVFVKHECPWLQQSPKLAIFSIKVKVTKFFCHRVTDTTKSRCPRIPFRVHKKKSKTHQNLTSEWNQT